jgi:hypothetical protein
MKTHGKFPGIMLIDKHVNLYSVRKLSMEIAEILKINLNHFWNYFRKLNKRYLFLVKHVLAQDKDWYILFFSCPNLKQIYCFLKIIRCVIIFDSPEMFKGIVSNLTIKFWMCQKCGKMKDYNNKNEYRCCRMITNTLDIIIITK